MKKTVGMITIYRKNYGAFLQAYALQQTLIRQGFKPEIIRYDYYKDHTIMGIGLEKIKNPIFFSKMLAVEIFCYKAHRKRQRVFDSSVKKHILESEEYYKTYKELEKKPPKYDIYLTGSDQVFNPSLSQQALSARLLRFVQSGDKMSYAASAGRSDIPQEKFQEFGDALKTFSTISVRESGLRDFIEQKYGINVVQNIDPTLLLTKDQWENFGETNNDAKGDYIFYYRVLKQDKLKEKASYISQKLNLPIYVADGNDSFPNQLVRTKDLSPEEWVGMMANAKYVVTNSFHGVAFAINLRKRVSILIPPSGGTRITDLIEKCNLTEVMKTDVFPECNDEIYKDAQQYLIVEREKARKIFEKLHS